MMNEYEDKDLNDFEKNNQEIIEFGPNGNNEVLQETSNRTIKQRLKTAHNEEIAGGKQVSQNSGEIGSALLKTDASNKNLNCFLQALSKIKP